MSELGILGMRRFAELYQALDDTTSSLDKQSTLQAYFSSAAPGDSAWAVYFLSSGRPKQMVPSRLLRQTAQSAIGLEDWLFQECYDTVGDLSETFHLLLPQPTSPNEYSLAYWLGALLALRDQSATAQAEGLKAQWREIPSDQRLIYFKLIMGSFRVGVSRLQVTQALAKVANLDSKLIAQRLMGFIGISQEPQALDFLALMLPELTELQSGLVKPTLNPFPFYLAHTVIDKTVGDEALGTAGDWLVEWKWDGIRAQVLKRGGALAIWSRGEELVTDRFPEVLAWLQHLPDGTTLDGELVIADHRAVTSEDPADLPFSVRPFAELQRRIGRKKLSPALLKKLPAMYIAFDVLEWQGVDRRDLSQRERRALLSDLGLSYGTSGWAISPSVQAASWASLRHLRQQARILGAEGLMLKAMSAKYGVGRTKSDGTWFKWKLDPFVIDAVLIYAQKGHGRRGGLFSDYTFAVWQTLPDTSERQLVPFAKAYSGLTDLEIKEVDSIIKKTTKEAFGPVRSVEPSLVFEIGFEGISLSKRHSSGVATRFPRMLRWRRDKLPEEADTLETLLQLARANEPAFTGGQDQ